MITSLNNPWIDLSQSVKSALDQNKPVVALESTIIAHGMPWPENFDTAIALEDTIKKTGVTPATIAILNGRIKVGLNLDQLEQLAQAGSEVIKCSRRDLPYVCTQKKHGATTVAATMAIAKMAGISLFATGGIGGVHRDAHQTFDISADLTELGQTDVGVICAGAKSILDLSLTREYLETQGVPVVGYKTSQLPAFYSRTSAETVDYCLNSPKEIAAFLHAKWSMNLKGGVVIANPIPEEGAIPEEIINDAIGGALLEANRKGIKGKESTPFLLKKISEITQGNSLASNIKLAINNAQLAANIAIEMSKLDHCAP